MRKLRLVAIALVLALGAGSAAAQTPEDEVKKLLKRAIDDYDNLNLDRALVSLQAAITLGKVHKLKAPIVAQCYLRIGLIYNARNKIQKSIDAFIEALKIEPTIKPDPAVMNPKATAAFNKAKALAPKPVKKPPPPPPLVKKPPPPPPPPKLTEADFLHVPPTMGKEEEAVRLSVQMPKRRKGVTLVARFRRLSQMGYDRRDFLETVAGEFEARIPSRLVKAPEMLYYIEVVDEKSKVVVTLGSAGRPFRVVVKAAKPPPPPPPPPSKPRFLISVMAGSGFGIVGGLSDGSGREIKTGAALAAFHSSIELGYAVTPTLEVALQARFQISPGTTFGVEPRVRWLPKKGKIRPYLQFGVAVVQLRHKVDLRPAEDADDTITAGIVGIGVGGGVEFRISKHFGLALEAHTLTVFPDTTLGIDAGVRFRFRF